MSGPAILAAYIRARPGASTVWLIKQPLEDGGLLSPEGSSASHGMYPSTPFGSEVVHVLPAVTRGVLGAENSRPEVSQQRGFSRSCSKHPSFLPSTRPAPMLKQTTSQAADSWEMGLLTLLSSPLALFPSSPCNVQTPPG